MLTERQRMILHAIVDDYIRSAEPVGSRSISKRGDVGFSPATIRNEMADLEELGFLEQPHTSAGRVPSTKGYRYYVDHLVKLSEVDENDIGVVRSFVTDKMNQMEQVIQQTAMILSNLTNYTSILLGPEMFSTSLKHFGLVPLDQTSAVAIIVTNTGHVENRTISIQEAPQNGGYGKGREHFEHEAGRGSVGPLEGQSFTQKLGKSLNVMLIIMSSCFRYWIMRCRMKMSIGSSSAERQRCLPA